MNQAIESLKPGDEGNAPSADCCDQPIYIVIDKFTDYINQDGELVISRFLRFLCFEHYKDWTNNPPEGEYEW